MLFEARQGFIPRNVQPGTESRLPVCPNYSLIEVCAKLAGIDPNALATDNNFCGVEHEDNIGFLSGHRGDNYIPSMVCTKIRDRLTEMMYWAKKDVALPEKSLTEAIATEGDPTRNEQLLQEALQKTQEFNKKQQILSQWRHAVYEISCVPPESKSPGEPHFKPRRIDELSDKEIIGTVETFLKSLEDHVTGQGSNLREGRISLSLSATHCRRSPHYEQTGEFS